MTIEERARDFVVSRGDGTPDEMGLYASIASSFATIEREAAVVEFSERTRKLIGQVDEKTHRVITVHEAKRMAFREMFNHDLT